MPTLKRLSSLQVFILKKNIRKKKVEQYYETVTCHYLIKKIFVELI